MPISGHVAWLTPPFERLFVRLRNFMCVINTFLWTEKQRKCLAEDRSGPAAQYPVQPINFVFSYVLKRNSPMYEHIHRVLTRFSKENANFYTWFRAKKADFNKPLFILFTHKIGRFVYASLISCYSRLMIDKFHIFQKAYSGKACSEKYECNNIKLNKTMQDAPAEEPKIGSRTR